MHVPKKVYRQPKAWAGLLLLVALVRLFSANEQWVEKYYSGAFYPAISRVQRILFGWLPFSIGDLLYLAAGGWLAWALFRYIRSLFRQGFRGKVLLDKVVRVLFLIITIYVVFNILWGINYNRQGINYQLGIDHYRYDSTDVKEIEQLLLKKVNHASTASIGRNMGYPSTNEIFNRAAVCYREAARDFPFLKYAGINSMKTSLFGWLGNTLGFTGYYNPFTGEAQVNTSVPAFLQPYIAAHEIGHQLGYGKEDEASFAGYLAVISSRDSLFHYSAYLDLFLYANREMYYIDSNAAKHSFKALLPPVREDIEEWRRFNLAHRSFLEPVMTWLYGNYLKLNEQPKGMRSYNEVLSMLIAYHKKYGRI